MSIAGAVGATLLLIFLTGSPLGAATLSIAILGACGLWVAYYARRAHLRSLGLEEATGSQVEQVGNQVSSFVGPITIASTLALGVALGLGGALGGQYVHVVWLVAGGVMLSSALIGLVTLGRAYSRYASLAGPPEEAKVEPFEGESTQSQLSNSHGVAAILVLIAFLSAFSYSQPIAGLVIVNVYLIAFLVLVREHRVRLWRFPKLLEFRVVWGLAAIGLLVAQAAFVAPLGICAWLAVFASAVNFAFPMIIEPKALTMPSATLAAVEHLLDVRRMRETAINGTIAAIDRALGLRVRPHPLPETDFRGSSLRGHDYSGQTLSFIDFGNADLRGARFDRCRLEGINFARADLRDASFRGATIVYAMLAEAELAGADFSQSRLFLCDLTGCSLIRTSFSEAFMRGLTFDESTSWPTDIQTDEIASKRGPTSRVRHRKNVEATQQ